MKKNFEKLYNIRCPKCNKEYSIPENVLNRDVVCSCGNEFKMTEDLILKKKISMGKSCFCMFLILFIFLILPFIWYFQSGKTKSEIENNTIEIQEKQQKSNDDMFKSEAEYIKLKLCMQLDSLMEFRLSEDFIKYGFGRGGKYYSWLETSIKIRDRANKLPMRYYDLGVAAGELLQIGLDYANSKGKTTKYVDTVLPDFLKKIGYDDYRKEIDEISNKRNKNDEKK